MKNLVLMTFIVAPLAMADPFQPKNIPAESQWHLHGDLTGLRKTNTGGFLLDQIRKGEADTIIDIETLFGFDLLEDLTDITLFGTGKADEIAITLSGEFARAQLEEVIVQADGYNSTTYGTTKIHSWKDTDRTQHAGFHDNNTVIISQKKGLLKLALDVLTGKTPGLKADLTPPSEEPVVVAYANIQKIKIPLDEGSHIIRKADSILITLAEKQNRLVANMVIKTGSKTMAKRMMHALAGLVSLSELADKNIEGLDILHSGQTSGKIMTMTMSLPAANAFALISKLK